MRRLLKKPKLLVGIGAVLALLALALWPSPVPADFAAAERGSLRVTIDEEGETRLRDRFVVSAPVAGRVLRIELEPGDRVVREKTVVATFLPGDPVLLDARARAEAQAALGAAEAALGRARSEWQRVQDALALARSERDRNRELALLTLLALPLGLLVGWGLSYWALSSLQNELYRIPLVIGRQKVACSALTVIAAAAISGLVVRRKLDRLDLVAVLKTRE